MSNDTQAEHLEAAEEAMKAAELAHSNIRRYLDLQASLERPTGEPTLRAAKAAGAAAELAAINIRRYLDLRATMGKPTG